MCDPSLTDTDGRSSEFPEELEPWREVDVTDVEEKMRGLRMEQEADFSEPEQVQLAQPVLAAGPSSALPSTSSTPSPAADGTLPVDGGSSPTSEGHKSAMDEKKKVIAKAAPSSVQKALNDLRPFLRFADGAKDSDADLPKARSTSVPRASSKPRSRSKSKQPKKERQSSPKRSKTPPRSRSRPLSPTRDRVLGCVPGQPELAGFTPGLDPLPVYFTSHSPLPTNLHDPKWKQGFLQWTVDDCRLSWKKGELAWVN